MRRRISFIVNSTLLLLVASICVWNVRSQTTPKSVKNSMGMEFVRVPSGSFTMGSPASESGRSSDEVQRRVTIGYEFYLGKHEVTIAHWKKLMGDLPEGMKTGLDAKFLTSEKQPVVRISWNDAKGFIDKLNSQNDGYTYRLPSEAEWEYASRAGNATPFGLGDGSSLSSSQANFDGTRPYGKGSKGKYLERTTSVGSYKPNAWGLYDMHGNVSEWVEDIWSDGQTGLPTDGSANLTRGDASQRIQRGGSWNDGGEGLRSADHFFSPPANRSTYTGFRLVAGRKPVTIKMK